MHRFTRFLPTLALAVALTGAAAHAQLQLSGYTTGSFDDLGEDNTTVTNAGDGSSASFTTGIPVTGSTQSSIQFQNADFTNVTSGEPIQVGFFNITNGQTEIGSGAQTARFNLGLQLNSPEMQALALSTIVFHIDHTPNLPNGVPDTFAVTFDQPAAIRIQDTLVQFHVNVDPAEFQLPEDATTQKGDITVTFTPVPEPSTYAAWGAALLVGLVAVRRFRGQRAARPLAS